MKYGLIGEKLTHSYSKEIHEMLDRYTYDLFSLPPDKLTDFIGSTNFGGLNITIPYKQQVIPLCHEITPLAEAIGAVNTLYWKTIEDQSATDDATKIVEDQNDTDNATKIVDTQNATSNVTKTTTNHNGTDDATKILVGHNTDYEGFLYAASRAGISFRNETVLILGDGGTSLTARKAVMDKGADRIYIASRKALETNDAAPVEENKFSRISYTELSSIADSITVIVNTTPVGTFPGNLQSIISLRDFPHCRGVIDVIYNPFKTRLIMEAEELGIRSSNGLPMLVAQATAAAGYFLGAPGAFEERNEAIIDALTADMQNIVLIGMPGCGKSTIGKIISTKTGKGFIDMDSEIVNRSGMSIPEIFENEGEDGFRNRETLVAEAVGRLRGKVIATGGGAVLRPQNLLALKQNGVIIHITRPVSSLTTYGRPLSSGSDALAAMAEKRLPIYEAAADITFNNSATLTPRDLKYKVLKMLAMLSDKSKS